MNRVIIGGHIGNDVEVRYTQSTNKMVVNFSIATREGKDKTEWHKVIAWDKTAEFISKYFKKGSYILVTGHLQTRTYEDKDGKTVYVTEIVAETVEFGGNNQSSEPNQDEQSNNFTPVSDDDLPF